VDCRPVRDELVPRKTVLVDDLHLLDDCGLSRLAGPCRRRQFVN
jgi:hypothetical protein